MPSQLLPRMRLSKMSWVSAFACLLITTHVLPVQASTPSADSESQKVLHVQLHIEIPRLQVAEYHRPYVAIWLADERGQAQANLGVWYDLQLANREGEKWLKDLRQWWRRTGRTLNLPMDGVSGATRAPGKHQVSYQQFAADGTDLQQLPAGNYTIFIEAAREVGGRELLALPVQLPLTAPIHVQAQGESELGHVYATLSMQ